MTHENDGQDQVSAGLAQGIPATDFVATVIDDGALEPLDKRDPRWWSESSDGRCSESAALFAASQPAPLSVV